MFLVDKKKEDQESDEGKESLWRSIDGNKEGERRARKEYTAQFNHSADQRAKEAEKKTDMPLLIESNASRWRSQEIMKKDILRQENEIKEVEYKLKLLKWSIS